MLKTDGTFVAVTSEKHASSAPARAFDHPLCTCKTSMLISLSLPCDSQHFCSPTLFAAVVDFADPSDSGHFGYSESFPFELESLN
jgi:hypothetical protein